MELTIPHIEIKKEIGKGGFGVVYEAFHKNLQIPVAVKVLNKDLDLHNQIKFQSEAHLMARMDHPNIIRVFEFSRINQQPFMVLEWMGLSKKA